MPFNNPMTQQGLINQFDNLALQVPNDTWYMDSGASSHMASNAGILHTPFNFSNYAHPDIVVGNGSTLPVSQIGNSQLPSHPNLKLNNILISPPLVKNLISVRQFTKDNNCSIEFDPYGFSVKNLTSQVEIFRCNSHGDLYPVTNLKNHSSLLAYPSTSTLWHRRLGHPGSHVFQFLVSNKFIDCNRNSSLDICDACQLGKHVKLPFNNYSSPTFAPFDIIHADLWTSPIYSVTSYKYYLVLLDNFTHYSWVYPLRHKSEVYAKFQDFHALIKTQFNSQIKAFQCDHGREFDNQSFQKFFASLGIIFRFPCPHTSQQNGKAERIIRTLNNISRTLLFQARLPPSFWVESLYMANHLLNLTPTTTINYMTPYEKLFHSPPTYSHLRVFGCLCYPNTSATMPHKLAPRSRRCIFLGFPAYHRGYKCLDLDTGKIIISRHVVFNENCFPYSSAPLDTSTYDFLEPHDSPSPAFHLPTKHLFSPAPTVNNHPTPTPSQATTTNSSSPPPSSHPMVTRRMTGNLKPRILMNLSTSTISPIPHSYKQALKDLNWTKAMQDEYNALIENDTWDLVPCPTNAPIVSGKWLYRHKFNSDGSLERHKARWVVRGFTQTPGVDFDETFSPVVKPATIRTVLSIAVSHSWPIHQMDVKNAFLHGDIKETIYCQQPSGFVDPSHPNHVCRLKKALYGLKQAPRAWYQKFASFITSIGFTSTKSDSSLFVYNKGSHIAYLLLYVDDILLTASSDTLLRDIMTLLSKQFSMKDLGTLNYFLGISATFTNNSLFLTQDKFSQEILKRAGMESCHSVSTPVDTNPKLSANSGAPIPNPTTYRELTGALQYLTFTRPDITYAVQQLCLFMHDPREHHWQALKRVLRYVKGTSSYGLWIHPSSTDRLVAYSDADWAGCPDSRRSTSGFCIFLGENLVSWSSKRQTTVSRSSAEAEYRSVANTAAECCWLRNLLTELLCPVSQASIIFCDNISAVYLSGNPVQHHRTKHIEIDIHFVRDLVSINQIRVLHVPSSSQFADIFTKGLPSSLFRQFRSSLSIRLPPASTARAC